MSDSPDVAQQLLSAGLLDRPGDVDIPFYTIRLALNESAILVGLEKLASQGKLAVHNRWRCPSCGDQNDEERIFCGCGEERSVEAIMSRVFRRPHLPPSRDVAALFLIHGMNTLGEWQESLAWRISLLYGYAIPTFVFKYGHDLASPLTVRAQTRRMHQLAQAVHSAQADLKANGKNVRCDVIAHSFGTLLFAKLLESQSYSDLVFGKVILSGSIVPVDFQWDKYVSLHRIESILNHRAGGDIWVRLAPWFFPCTGSSGHSGFRRAALISDVLTPTFSHSDYFASQNFDGVIKQNWTEFLTRNVSETKGRSVTPGNFGRVTRYLLPRRYWVGRGILLLVAGLICVLALHALAIVGKVAQQLVDRMY